jgi:hypothetical protein
MCARLAAAVLCVSLLGTSICRAQATETDAAEATESAEPKADAGRPTTAAAALVQATAAYEYGDMLQVVEATRPVAEGNLTSRPEQLAQALRLLGIGLYLTDRPLGAETAFSQLLRLDPEAHLDPTVTRPEVVVFFENIRQQHRARERSSHWFGWSFLPPVGQFQNGDHAKAWILLSLEVASLTTFVTTGILLRDRCNSDQTCGPGGSWGDTAKTTRALNWISAGTLAASYIYGVIDGVRNFDREDESRLSVLVFPGGGGLRLTF